MPEVGDLVAAKFRLLAVLGRGGMGIVFDAHHELLDRRVALKVLAPEVSANLEAVTRFMNEARAAARITSERVVQVLDVGSLDNGLPYMVMERLEGIDLAQLATQQTAIGISDVVDLLVEAIEGVSHAHLEGIIHRDLKPSNLFLAQRPDRTQVVKVLDFGISKLTGPGRSPSGSVTATSAILGSPLYMSPEQLRSSKSIDQRADVWSLGVIAYELLTRTLPFEGDNLVELFVAIQERDARPLTVLRPDVPDALDEAVRRCLRRSPDDRFSSAYAFGKTLVPFGGAKARAAIDRLEAHISSKGRSVDELRSTEPEPAPHVTPPPRFAITPATLQSDPRIAPRPVTNGEGNSVAPVSGGVGRSTASPWSVTGGRRSRPAIGVSVLAVVGTVVAGASLVFVLHGKLDTARASGAAPTDVAVDSAVDSATLLAPAPVLDAATSPPPLHADESPPPAPASPTAPSASALRTLAPPRRHGLTPATPPSPTPPAQPAANPMNMKPL